MNIGIDVSPLMTTARTGVGEYTFELLNALFEVDKKNQYFLFYNASKKVKENFLPWEQKNVHTVVTRFPNKIFHVTSKIFRRPLLDTFIVNQYHKKQQTNIGHLDAFFSPNINFFSFSNKCRNILVVHDLSFELLPECFSTKMRLWHSFLQPRRQCEKSGSIVVPSYTTKRDLVDVYAIPEEKIHVLSPGTSSLFTEENFSKQKQVKEKYNLPEKFILFIGTLEPRKNIEAVIEAFTMLQAESKNYKEYQLIIAGAQGWKYKGIVKRIEKTPQVRYLGYIQSGEKPALMRLASLFVFPSLYEGFGLPVLEAMASGTPVITSNRSALPEITNGATYLVNPLHIEEIKIGMERILSSEDLRNAFIKKGKQHAQKFQWKSTAEKFLDLINS